MARVTADRAGRSRGTALPQRRAASRGVPRRTLGVGGALLVLVAAAVFVLARPGAGSAGGAIATLQTGDFHALAFSPTEADVVFFGHHNGLLRSTDGGRTWQPLVERRGFDAMALAVSRTDPGRLYLAGHDVFQVSTDGGATWRAVQHTLPGTDIHAFALSPDDPTRLFAFIVGHGVVRSSDGGRTWERLPGQLPPDVTALASAGGQPETLYVASAGSGLLRSTDGGATWLQPTGDGAYRTILALAVDPVARQTVYAGAEGGLYKSTDGGATWMALPYPGDNAVALAVSPSAPNVALAISVSQDRQGLVYRSDDGGATWGSRG